MASIRATRSRCPTAYCGNESGQRRTRVIFGSGTSPRTLRETTARQSKDGFVGRVEQSRRGWTSKKGAEQGAALRNTMREFLIDKGAGEELRLSRGQIVILRDEKSEAFRNLQLRCLLTVEREGGDYGRGYLDIEPRLQFVVPRCDELPRDMNRGCDNYLLEASRIVRRSQLATRLRLG